MQPRMPELQWLLQNPARNAAEFDRRFGAGMAAQAQAWAKSGGMAQMQRAMPSTVKPMLRRDMFGTEPSSP
jgi:hypothetical protein